MADILKSLGVSSEHAQQRAEETRARLAIEDERRARRKRAAEDPEYFCQYYLAHYFRNPITGEFSPLGSWQHDVIDDFQDEKQELFAYAAPRGHGKTTFLSFAFTLRDLLRGASKFTLYIGPNFSAACDRIGEIKMELENNERIIEDYGDLLRKGESGGEVMAKASDLRLSNGARIAAKGAGQAIRGIKSRENRPDRIILDDVDKDGEVASAEQLEKRVKWFKRVVLGLRGAGRCKVLVIGNIIGTRTLLTDCLANKRFRARIYKAIQDDGTLLMPGLWTLEKLEAIREEIGSDAFQTEFQNSPPAEGTRPFRAEWLRRHWTPEQLAAAAPGIMTALDLSKGKTERSDFQAFVAIRRDDSGNIFVLKADLGRRTRKELAARALQLVDVLGVSSITGFGVEVNGFQEWFSDELDEQSSAQGYDLPIVKVENKLDKFSRVARLSPIAEGGRLWFPPEDHEAWDESMKLLIRQMIEFPEGRHDDGPDALAMAVDLSGSMLRQAGAVVIDFSIFDREAMD
ncbi:MAG TPA: hypothetical protein VK181_02445 [Rhizobium sp.]|nr:hypothetical protein [Rhizobium sp.]